MEISKRKFLQRAIASTGAVALMPALSAHAATLKAPEKWDLTTDVLVAGGGIAGCMAAIEAAKAGCNVMLVHAGMSLGGSSKLSGAVIRATGSKWQQEIGAKDTLADYEQDALSWGKGTRDVAKVKVIASLSGEFIDVLSQMGVQFSKDDSAAPAYRPIRTEGGGTALMKAVEAEIKKYSNIHVHTEAKIIDVYRTMSPDRIEGALVEIDEEKKSVAAKAIIIATGGFGRNRELLAKYAYEWKDAHALMDLNCFGQGMILAAAQGAGVANLHITMATPLVEHSKKLFYTSRTITSGAIYVNENGQRFVNEYVMYTDTPRAMNRQKAVYQIVSKNTHAYVEKMIADGTTTQADSIEELAAKMNVPLENIKHEIEEHNRITALDPNSGHRVDRFGRTAFKNPLVAPFYFVRMQSGIIETVGGFTINEKAQAINFRNEPVAAGLYGAGAVAFGEHFGAGYRSGDSYVYSGVLGMVAGREAASYAKN